MADKPGTKGNVTIAVGEDVRSVVSRLVDVEGTESVTVLPSSLRRRDSLAGMVRQALREANVESHLEVPENLVASLSRLGRNDSTWRAVELSPPDRASHLVRLPARVLDAPRLWLVTDVDAVSGRGPYVLDLLARYVDPVTRARHLGSRERATVPVEVNLARRPDWFLAVKHAGDLAVGVGTGDPIVAELMALSLADEDLTRDHRVTGPWEDPMVQRATELDLGARLPREVRVVVEGHGSPADATISRILSRLGVKWP